LLRLNIQNLISLVVTKIFLEKIAADGEKTPKNQLKAAHSTDLYLPSISVFFGHAT